MYTLIRVISFIITGGIFSFVIFYVPPPSSWQQATVFQILLFFIPFLLLFTTLINIFLRYLPRSIIIALGTIILSVLQSINALNILTAAIVLITTFYITKSFPVFHYNLRWFHKLLLSLRGTKIKKSKV